jgi:hypothetical protein
VRGRYFYIGLERINHIRILFYLHLGLLQLGCYSADRIFYLGLFRSNPFPPAFDIEPAASSAGRQSEGNW